MSKKNKPFLSVIIPVYNGSPYLRETIESILNQPCDDFELLLMDDGSKDNSLAICRSYESDNVRVFTQTNRGVSLTRNEGIERADGQWIIFVDQDDAMRKDFYTEERKAKLLELDKQQVNLIVPGAWWCDSQLKTGHRRYIEKETKCRGVYPGHSNALSWDHMLTFNMCLYSRALFFNADGTPTPVRFFSLLKDVETTFRHMALYAAQKILFSDDFAFCLRRCNEESVSSTWDWMEVYPVVFDAYTRLIDWHNKNYPEDKDTIVGSEKALLRRVSSTIREVNEHNQEDLGKLKMLVINYFGGGAQCHCLLKQYPSEGQAIRSLLWEQRVDNRCNRILSLKTLAKSYYLTFLNKLLCSRKVSIRGNLL